MKIISFSIFLLVIILMPFSAYLYAKQTSYKIDDKTRSINYVLNPKDFVIKIDKETKTLTLNKGTAFVKIDLDSDTLNEFLKWPALEDGVYLPPSSCKKMEINLAQESFKKDQNIKFSNITCVV